MQTQKRGSGVMQGRHSGPYATREAVVVATFQWLLQRGEAYEDYQDRIQTDSWHQGMVDFLSTCIKLVFR